MSGRPRCRSCGAGGLRTFLSLGEMPLTDAYVRPEHEHEPEPRYPLDVAFCAKCSLVQILQASRRNRSSGSTRITRRYLGRCSSIHGFTHKI